MRVRRLSRLDYLSHSGVRTGISDIFSNASSENEYLLRNDSDILAERIKFDILDINSVYGDTTRNNVVHSGNKIRHGTLTASRMTYKSHVISRFNVEGNVLQDGTVGGIVEADVIKYDIALDIVDLNGLKSSSQSSV